MVDYGGPAHSQKRHKREAGRTEAQKQVEDAQRNDRNWKVYQKKSIQKVNKYMVASDAEKNNVLERILTE